MDKKMRKIFAENLNHYLAINGYSQAAAVATDEGRGGSGKKICANLPFYIDIYINVWYIIISKREREQKRKFPHREEKNNGTYLQEYRNWEV